MRIYSCFEKSCLTKGEKLALQCRKLLWVSEPQGVPALSKETAQTRFHVFFFLLALTLRTSSKQPQTITTQNINRYCHVSGTTCVEIAVKNFFKNYIQVSCFDVEFITLVLSQTKSGGYLRTLAFRCDCSESKCRSVSQKTVLPRESSFNHVSSFRYIRSINRQNLPYKLAPNHLVDLTDEEYDRHAGKK